MTDPATPLIARIHALPTAWIDAGGVSHAPGHSRRRIVSLVPSLTESVCTLGARDLLIGCTAFCVRPRDLIKKSPNITVVGGTKTVLREKLLNLQPDLILMNMEENTLEDIDFFKSRVECYLNGTKTLEEGIQSLNELGSLLGTPEPAAALVRKAIDSLTQVRAEAARHEKRPKLFYAIWREPWMSINRDTFIHDHLMTCGAEDIFADRAARYPVVTIEEIAAAAPDIIWLPSEPYRFKEKHCAEIRNLIPGAAALIDPRIEKATAKKSKQQDIFRCGRVFSSARINNLRVELLDGDNVCWFGARQIEGMPYTSRRLFFGDNTE